MCFNPLVFMGSLRVQVLEHRIAGKTWQVCVASWSLPGAIIHSPTWTGPKSNGAHAKTYLESPCPLFLGVMTRILILGMRFFKGQKETPGIFGVWGIFLMRYSRQWVGDLNALRRGPVPSSWRLEGSNAQWQAKLSDGTPQAGPVP